MLHLEERLRMGDEIMKTYIYEGGFGIVAKSGVGSAIKHQKNMLKQADIEEAKSWKEADIVHINTVFPDSVLAACLAKMQGKKVVYYGHSTMEDFRNSFIGSNRFAPLFKKWICFCYGLGDIVITPTEYSKGLLKSYGIQKKIYAVSNGVDTEFFQSRNKQKEKQEHSYVYAPVSLINIYRQLISISISIKFYHIAFFHKHTDKTIVITVEIDKRTF